MWRDSILEGHHQGNRPIAQVISEDKINFNGFGQHTSQDLCHMLRFHPLMPCLNLCSDDQLFQRLVDGIPNYVDLFHGEAFIRAVAGNCNSQNPFEYHVNSNHAYQASYLWVYRKSEVWLTPDMYNAFLQEGLLDSKHTLGIHFSCFISILFI